MKIATKDILVFCIDRSLRQFHRPYKWTIVRNPESIPQSIRDEITSRKPDFFTANNFFVVVRTSKMSSSTKQKTVEDVANVIVKGLTGGESQTNTDFVQEADETTLIAGLSIG